MWGTYWVWDARLTSMLVLFLLYLGLIALWQSIEEPGRAGRAAAILALVGFVNVPIIKFSVDWWNTLHQPASIFRIGGPTIDPVAAHAALRHGRRLHAAVRAAASHRHARRDLAPPRARAAPGACRARRCWLEADARAMPDLGPARGLHLGRLCRDLRRGRGARCLHRRRTTAGSGGFSPSSSARASRGARPSRQPSRSQPSESRARKPKP